MSKKESNVVYTRDQLEQMYPPINWPRFGLALCGVAFVALVAVLVM